MAIFTSTYWVLSLVAPTLMTRAESVAAPLDGGTADPTSVDALAGSRVARLDAQADSASAISERQRTLALLLGSIALLLHEAGAMSTRPARRAGIRRCP